MTVTTSQCHEDMTNLPIAILSVDGTPAISIRASDCGEPICHQFRNGKPVRIHPSHPDLTFEQTVSYWALVLQGKATIHASLDRAA